MMYEELLSKTSKKYLENEHIIFEDWQKAWLVYHSDRDCEWIRAGLREIADETSDAQLKEQIDYLAEEERVSFEAFKKSGGNAVYVLMEWYADDDGATCQGYYADYALAWQMAEKLHYSYEIHKEELIRSENNPAYGEFGDFVDNGFGRACFDKNGKLTEIWSCEIQDWRKQHPEPEDMFHRRYFSFKHPFKRGDILKPAFGNKDKYLRIVVNEPERNMLPLAHSDYSDSGIYPNCFDPDTGIIWDSDEPENPYLFDFYEIGEPSLENTQDLILYNIQKILRGEGASIQTIQDGCQYLRENYDETHKLEYITGFRLKDSRYR